MGASLGFRCTPAAPDVSDEFDEAIVARSLTRAGLGNTSHTFFKEEKVLPGFRL